MENLEREIGCNFLNLYGQSCSGEVVKLVVCKNDISGHLRWLKVTDGDLTEDKLIVSRAACLTDVSYESADTSICQHHRLELGVRWRRCHRICQYPKHTGKAKPDRLVNYQMHQEILQMYSREQHLPVGESEYMRLELTFLVDIKM